MIVTIGSNIAVQNSAISFSHKIGVMGFNGKAVIETPFTAIEMKIDDVRELRDFLNAILYSEDNMPIPGDNGHPQQERDAQNERITKEANTGADVRKELRMDPPAPKEKNIFGVM